MARLPRSFYARPTLQVAPDLLGKVLVHRTPAGITSGMIVEVEAYVGESDPACHAAPGPTRRNAPLYGPPGYSYVYLNYGVHYLVNVVTEAKGDPAAVLIRALDPLDGIALMGRRRARTRTAHRPRKGVRPLFRNVRRTRGRTPFRIADADLCKGPGNVTHAMGISLRHNGIDLLGKDLYIEDRGYRIDEVRWSRRIGITVGTERHWRCYAAAHTSVSGSKVLRF